MIDIRTDELLRKLLSGDVDCLSDQDKSTLMENREGVIPHLNAIFSKEVPRLLEGEQCLDATALFLGFKLAGFLEASEAFQWLQKLCYLSREDLDQSLGAYFITEELAYLLTATMRQWSALKSEIENPTLDEFIRSACLNALALAVANGSIERLEIMDYFKSLFHRILNGELDDELLCTRLVSCCSDLWPEECLEEIRESFGLCLVDEGYLDLNFVLTRHSQGKEFCIERLQIEIEQQSFWEARSELPELFDENQERQWDKLLQLFKQADEAEANRVLKGPSHRKLQRNEICNCGSGRKYKKCCMNQSSLPHLPPKIRIEESIVSYDPLEQSDAMKALPEDVQESILAFYNLAQENPEKVVATAPMYIEKYPDIPMLYNFLYGAYRSLNRPREALKLVKETLRIFPDYLFARVEYALYLLRRGEPDKAHAVLGKVGTLPQLYPEREIFHAAEWKAFSYAMGVYWIQKDNINQAKVYLGIVEEIAPRSNEVKELRKEIKNKLFLQSIERQQKERALLP